VIFTPVVTLSSLTGVFSSRQKKRPVEDRAQ